MKKSVSILFCFLVMILSISAVSAADMDLDPELALPKSDVGIGASDGEVLADDGSGDFTSLQNSIDDDGSTLILTSDYKRVDGDSDVSITKDVTIIGNNHKIDADKKGGIFKVNTGCTLTLIGVTLINGNNENGGAIYNDGGVLNIVNSQLINNTATESGGAIYNAKSSSIYVSSSTFDGNDLTDRHFNGWGGAAIYNDGGSIIMDDCRVTNNLKNIVHRGGTGNYAGDLSSAALASYNDGSVIITNSYFANNSGSYGGAILFDKGVLDIRNTAFVNNFAFNGGAIDIVDGTYTISNCTFKENNAKGTGSTINNNAHGGALCIVYETAGECVVSDCIFEDNSAVYGGAVSNSNAKFVDCTFINNTASASNSETFNGKRNNRGGFGGAIYSDKQITVIDSNFTNNTSRSYGLYIKNADISGSSFNNSAINVVGTIDVNDNENAEIFCALYGNVNIGSGEIPSVKSGTVYYAPTSFADLQTLINNCASKIRVTCDVTKLASEEETFANGITVAKSITIDMLGHTITSNNGKVFNIAKGITLTLINATVIGDGNAAIYNEGTLRLSLSNPSNFDNFGDYAIDNNGVLYKDGLTTFTQLNDLINLVNGGEIQIFKSKITQTEEEKDNFANGILINKDLTITGYYYKDILAKIDAAKYSRIFNVVDGATLTLNKIILSNGNADKGAGVYVEDGASLIVNSVKFINNTAVTRGGAIYSEGNVAVNKAIFDGNDVTFRSKNVDNGGAAIYALGGKLTVADSNFTNNLKDYVVRGTDGKTGDLINAIITTSAVTEITGSRFVNNSGCYGGAIYAAVIDNVGTPSLLIRDSEFVNNTAYAGTIQIVDIEYEISDSVFDGNKALGYGSVGYTAAGAAVTAMYPGANGLVTNCTFTNNRVSSTATPKGGAIVAQNGKIHIAGSKFENNSVFGSELAYGGAICGDSSVEMIIENSNFTNNTAAKGGAIYSDGKSLSVSNSNFKDNNGIGTIYNNAELTLAENKIQSTNIGIINDKGTIESKVYAKIMENTTYKGHKSAFSIAATLTDDAGNVIKDYKFNFVLTKDGVDIIVPAVFDDILGYYSGTFTPTNNGLYLISIDYPIKEVQTSVLSICGGLIDIANMVADAENGDTISLNGEKYAYTQEFDSSIVGGIVIDKNIIIDGKGSIISGSEMARLFKVANGYTLTLVNVTVCDAHADKGAGVYVEDGASLIVNSVKFINNTAVTRGGAIYSEGNVAVNKAIFDGNDVTFRSKNVDNGGAAIYALGGKLTVADSNFTNNLKDYVVRGTDGKTGDLINAIITTSAVTEITGSRFVNNSGCYGGAIYAAVIDNVGTPSLLIRDSEFVNNTAYAGTIQIVDIEYEISDSVFDGNKALGYGSVGYTAAGAAVTAMYPGANGLVTNCTFTNNRVSSTATPKGGAIVAQNGKIHIAGSKFENNSVFGSELAYGGAICGDSSVEMIIENSNFTNNTAAKGGAIYSDGKSLSVSNSNFKDNNGIGTIYNNAELTLAENKIQSTNIGIINDKGTVTTTINAIFLENKTLSAELGDVVELRATLTDDNGNAIKDYNFKFSVNGKTIEDITFDDGVYTTEYIIENVGEIVISTDYVADNLVKRIGIYEVPKAHITEFKVYVNKNEFKVGETVTVNVILRGVNDLGLNGDVVVILNNVQYTVKVNNGIGSFDVSGLASNTYAAFAFFNGDDNYNVPVFDNVIFKVMEPDYVISISVDDNVKVGEDATVKVSIPGASGVVKIIVDGAGTIITLDETGKAEYLIPNIAAGEHSIIAIYDGDETHNAVYNSAVLKVAKFASEVSVAGGNVVVGQDTVIKVSVTDGATGVVMIEVAGAYYSLDLSESDEISISLPVGEYSVVAKYMGDDKFDSSVSSPITVVVADKQVAHITIEAADVKVGEDATVSVSIPGASGVVKIIVDGVESVVDLDDGGKVSHVVSGLAAGEHSIVVVYDGDANYKAAHDSAVLKVAKFASEVSVAGGNVVVGQDTVIKVSVTDGATGVVMIEVAGAYYSLDLSESDEISISLPVGEYSVVAKYMGDDKFDSSVSSPITVVVADKQVAHITIEAADVKVGENAEVTITLPSDATGFVNVIVDGKDIGKLEIGENGTVKVQVASLKAGSHTIDVVYDGDDKYEQSSSSKIITVAKLNAYFEVPYSFTRYAVDYYGGERGAKFYAILKDENGNVLANKTVQIAICGPIYTVTTDEYGRAGLTINLATANRYTYALSFQGDEDYNAAPLGSTTLILNKKTTAINVKDLSFKSTAKTKTVSVKLTTIKNEYDGKTYLNAGKKITLKVNGKTYTAKTDANGVAKFNIQITKKGTYTATVNFAGDQTYKASAKSMKITIK